MTADLLAFLRAALDAAQKASNAATEETAPEWRAGTVTAGSGYDADAAFWGDDCSGVLDAGSPAAAQHIARHDPASALRRIAADRKVIAAHPHTTRVINPTCGLPSAGFGCDNCHNWDGVPEGRGYCDTILALAEGWGWTGETT